MVDEERTADQALEVLLEIARRERSSDLALVRACYDVERRHQYTPERERPLEEIRRLVEGYVRAKLVEPKP